jgi:hypothetical protein
MFRRAFDLDVRSSSTHLNFVFVSAALKSIANVFVRISHVLKSVRAENVKI